MSSAVIARGSLPMLAELGNAAGLKLPGRTKVFGVNPDAMRSGWTLVADPIHNRPRGSDR